MTRRVLITGGSSGIGLAISKALVKRGDQLWWVARTEEELASGRAQIEAEYPEASIQSLAIDLTTDGASDRVADWVQTLDGPLDVLINNAGFASWGFHDEISEARDLAMFQLNMVVPYLLTRRFLPAMKTRNEGRIINMASSAGMVNSPGFVTYGSTKAFLRFYSMSLSLELELEGCNVYVTAICPSAVRDTAFQAEAGMENTDIFSGSAVTTPGEVAQDVLRVLDQRRPTSAMVTGRVLRRMMPFVGLIPRGLMLSMSKKNLQRRD